MPRKGKKMKEENCKCSQCIWLRTCVPASDGAPHTCMGHKIEHPGGSGMFEYPGLLEEDLEKDSPCEFFIRRD